MRNTINGQTTYRAVYAVTAIGFAGLIADRSLSGASLAALTAVAAAFGFAELAPLRLPRGGQLVLAGGIVTAAITMLDPFAAFGSLLVGSFGAAAIRDHPPRPLYVALDLVRRLVGLALAWAIFALVVDGLLVIGVSDTWRALAAVIGGFVYMIVDLGSFALIDSLRRGRAVFRAMRRILVLVGGVYLSQVFVGAAITLVYPSLQLLSFAILVALMLVLQSSFMSFLRVREAYTRTLSALARLAECQAPDRSGHSERVAGLATTMGRHLHLKSGDISVLSYAALLHDVGDSCGSDSCTLSDSGARQTPEDLFDSIPFLTGAGRAIGASLVPHRFIDTAESGSHVLGGLLRVACAYDAMESGFAKVPEGSAVQSLLSASGSQYDPDAVASLQAVLARGLTAS